MVGNMWCIQYTEAPRELTLKIHGVVLGYKNGLRGLCKLDCDNAGYPNQKEICNTFNQRLRPLTSSVIIVPTTYKILDICGELRLESYFAFS